MVQAAFPNTNKLLGFCGFLGVLTYAIGYVGNLLSKATDKIRRKTPRLKRLKKSLRILLKS
jgi:hypothetical protein